MDVGVKHITLTFFLNMKRLSNDPLTVCAQLIVLVAILLLSISCEWDTTSDKVVEPEPVEDNNTPDPN
jgi:hypothetical protein|tara:strand:- start:441 stop:644 length:204 start_codon:yes stop_codon:yes gene_type:complete